MRRSLIAVFVLAGVGGRLFAVDTAPTTPKPSAATPSPGVTRNGLNGYLYMRATDDSIWQRKEVSRVGTTVTYAWESLGGVVRSEPAVAVHRASHLAPTTPFVFIRGSDDAVWYRSASATTTGWSWGAWQTLGGVITSAPAVTPYGYDLYVFARGSDGAIWYRVLLGTGAWSTWQTIANGTFSSAPTVVIHDYKLHVFAKGMDNAIWMNTKKADTAWSGWESIGGVHTSAPSAVNHGDLYVFTRGGDNGIWYRVRNRSSASWGQWLRIPGGVFTAQPAAMESDFGIRVYAPGDGNKIFSTELGSGQWVIDIQ